MFRKIVLAQLALVGLLLSAACAGQVASPTPQPSASPAPARLLNPTPQANMPNPASVYCEQHGGKLDLRTDTSGGVRGICVFPDKSECDEWAYFRGECQPGPAGTATPEVAEDGWKVYRDERLGYSFHYPADASLSHSDDPLKTLTIAGPATADSWPTIFVNHPSDRDEFRPPEGAVLEQWLIDHNLLPTGGPHAPELRQPDTTIAGALAIHTRFERSPQSYAYDKYFFAHAQQLYQVVILHTADREDWAVYNHFLDSFRFGA